MQKNFLHVLPVSDEEFNAKLSSAVSHFENYKKFSANESTEGKIYFEFGSGYDLLYPIVISQFGFAKLICIDIRELFIPELINNSILRLRNVRTNGMFKFEEENSFPEFNEKNSRSLLKERFRIDYIAPADSRHLEMKDNSVDFILTNAVMEHFSKEDLTETLKECYRVLKKSGVMSNEIDYKDHWSYADNKISCYNFLKFSEQQWRKYNPLIMFQNRLRHKDYVEMINEVGFDIVHEECCYPNHQEMEALEKLDLNEYYKKNYSLNEIGIKSSSLVLRKN